MVSFVLNFVDGVMYLVSILVVSSCKESCNVLCNMCCNNVLVVCLILLNDISKKTSYGVWNIVNGLLKVSNGLYINILYGYV